MHLSVKCVRLRCLQTAVAQFAELIAWCDPLTQMRHTRLQFRRCQHAKRGVLQPPAHGLFLSIIAAATHSSALLLLKACAESPLCGDWVAAQAATLLSKDARYAEELAGTPPDADNVRSGLACYM